MSHLFSPLTLRSVELENRVFVSPMCQYSSDDGLPTDWHLVHLGSRAIGGAALVLAEATAVTPEGRISPDDAGLWSDRHAAAYERIASFVKQNGAVPGVQLAHAGRKASTAAPWKGGGPVREGDGGWRTIAPSAIPFADDWPTPRAMSDADLDALVAAFAAATERALDAGFEVVELHAAHGYLLHQFLSPIANRREDAYGGSLENRMRLALRVVEAVRAVLPDRLPLLVRISATDWIDGGFDLEQSVVFARALADRGVDLVDCSTGGIAPNEKIPVAAGYQVPFAEAIRARARVATGAVGLITEPAQAEAIVASGRADAVLLARELLRDPYWPLHAARTLGAEIAWPKQYLRAKR